MIKLYIRKRKVFKILELGTLSFLIMENNKLGAMM